MTQPTIDTYNPAVSLTDRMSMLQQNGYGYLDPQVQASLAGSQESDQSVLSQAGTLTSAVRGAGNLIHAATGVFEDPVLYKKPSLGLWLHQFFTGQMGWQPVAQLDLNQIQTSLQKQGHGVGLPVNGVWTRDWQQAFSEAGHALVQQQTASEGGRGFSFTGALHGVLSSLMPSHAVPALVGALKALPGDVVSAARQVSGDVGGALGTLPDILTGKPFTNGKQYAHDEAAAKAATINTVGGHTTTAEEAANHLHNGIETLNTLLTVAPMFKAGSAIYDAGGQAVKQGLFTDLGKDEVQRGPGLISNLIYRPAGYYADEAGTQFVNQGGLMGARVFDHMPWLKQAVPAVRTATEGGQRFYYYKFRPSMSYLYRYPITQAGMSSAQSVMFTGALIRGDANLVNKIEGGDSPFANSVLAEKPWTGPVGFAADLLSATAHGPLTNRMLLPAKTTEEAAGRFGTHAPPIGVNPSKTLGDAARLGQAIHTDMLDAPGVVGAFERGTGLKYDKIVKAFTAEGLSEQDAQWTIRDKVDELAAADAAGRDPRMEGLVGHARDSMFRQVAGEIRQSPELLTPARAAFLDNDARMAVRFHQDSNKIEGAVERDQSRGLVAYAKARKAAYRLFNEHADELVGPHTFAAIQDAQDERQFTKALGGQVAGPEPGPYVGWMRGNNPEMPYASYGLARSDTQLQPDALRVADDLQQRIQDATDASGVLHAEPVQQVRRDAYDYIINHLGVDPRTVPASATDMVDMIRERAKELAAPIYKPLDPSPEALAHWQAVEDAGFKPVVGTNIGFNFAPPITDPIVVDGGITLRRKIIEHLGAGDTLSESVDAGRMHRLSTVRRWQDRANNGQINLPPGYTADLAYTHAIENMPGATRLTGLRGAIFKLRENRWRQIARNTFGPNTNPTEAEIDERLTALEKQLASQRSLLDLSQPQFVKAVTTPPKNPLINEMRGLADDAPLFTDEQARLMHLDMIRSLNDRPVWMFGLGKVEDLSRASLSFAGKAAAGRPVLSRVAALPNDVYRARNKIRFEIDPMFSARRITKSAVKLSMRGAPFSVTPFESMVRQGTLNDDLNLAQKLFPIDKGAAEGFDNLDRALYDADLFGAYNPRHFIAYGAGWFKRMGMTDDQVKQEVTKALTYGGRSALERSVGTIFYPFSFEKTLYKNLGQYLLDAPGRRLLALGAVDGYSALAQHYGVNDFLQQHVPLLKEIEKVNAFSHGVGPGQLGGINAPYASAVWNLFGPQHIQKPGAGWNAWRAGIPLLGEVNDLLVGYKPGQGAHGGDLTQQARITFQAAANGVDDVTRKIRNDPRSPWNPQTPAITYEAQQDQGWRFRNQLITKLAPAISYNYHHPNSPMSFADDKSLPAAIRGVKINHTSINEIVHQFFPAFDPNQAQTVAVQKQTEISRYVQNLKARHPDLGNAYEQFVKGADQFRTFTDTRIDDPAHWTQIAQLTGGFRDYAGALAEQDPGFLKFYNSYFRSTFGPIEEVTS